MQQLLTSRRVWTFIIAQVVSIATFLVANYVHDPVASQLAAILIGTVEGGATSIAIVQNAGTRTIISTIYALAINEYVEFQIYPVGGTNRTAWAGSTHFAMQRIG